MFVKNLLHGWQTEPQQLRASVEYEFLESWISCWLIHVLAKNLFCKNLPLCLQNRIHFYFVVAISPQIGWSIFLIIPSCPSLSLCCPCLLAVGIILQRSDNCIFLSWDVLFAFSRTVSILILTLQFEHYRSSKLSPLLKQQWVNLWLTWCLLCIWDRCSKVTSDFFC